MTENARSPFLVEEGRIYLIFSEKSELYEAVESLGFGKVMKKESGEPFLSDSPYHISLTHKDRAGVAAISREKVGVDMENVTVPRNVERLSRLFCEEERPASLYEFYKVWTGKEATGKMLGTGITADLLKSKTAGVRYLEFGDYLVGIVGEGEIQIKEYGKENKE